VLPTTDEPWMYGESSYHSVCRLPDGRWLAFLRGTGTVPTNGAGPTVGFATSGDGRQWDYFKENPVIAPGKPWAQARNKGAKEYRPAFIGYLGKRKSGPVGDRHEYLVAWAEHSNPQIIYSTTMDFKTFKRDPRGYAKWGGTDGLVTAWHEGKNLYFFAGNQVHVMG